MSLHNEIPKEIAQKVALFTAVFSPMEFYLVLPTLVVQLDTVIEKLHKHLMDNTKDPVGREMNEASYQMVCKWITDVKNRMSEIDEMRRESEGV